MLHVIVQVKGEVQVGMLVSEVLRSIRAYSTNKATYTN